MLLPLRVLFSTGLWLERGGGAMYERVCGYRRTHGQA